jgi:hypothetical protein
MQAWTNMQALNGSGYNLFLMLARQWEKTIHCISMDNSLN